jgi:hypothetical protein
MPAMPASLPTSPCGFVYVATGSGYLDEARLSAVSLRQHNPGVPVCLVTDQAVPAGSPFDQVLIRGDVVHQPIDKLLAIHCPFERAVFLDTDTRVFGDLSPLFAVLEQFDLALLQDVNRGWNYELPGVPMCFSEFNTGVIAFRRTPAVTEFFRQWRDNHTALARERGFVNDQPAFRQTLYRSPLRVAPLPSEFHFLGDFPNSTLWKVRLIHGRGDYQRVERQVNETLGLRAYVPELGVLPGYLGRKRLLRQLLRLGARAARLTLQGPESVTAKHPSKWWLEEGQPPAKPPLP